MHNVNIRDPMEWDSEDQCRGELSPPLVAIINHRGGQPASLGSLSPVIEQHPGLDLEVARHITSAHFLLFHYRRFGPNFSLGPQFMGYVAAGWYKIRIITFKILAGYPISYIVSACLSVYLLVGHQFCQEGNLATLEPTCTVSSAFTSQCGIP